MDPVLFPLLKDKYPFYRENLEKMLPLINNFTIPRAEYDGKNGLVKLAYKAFYTFYEGETDEEVIGDFYTNVSFTIDTNSRQLVFCNDQEAP